MGHNPATREGKIGNRKVVEETRSADEIIKGIRGNLPSHLSITPSDIAFLLAQHDAAASKIVELQSKIEFLAAAIVTMDAEKNRLQEMLQDNGEEFPDHGGEA